MADVRTTNPAAIGNHLPQQGQGGGEDRKKTPEEEVADGHDLKLLEDLVLGTEEALRRYFSGLDWAAEHLNPFFWNWAPGQDMSMAQMQAWIMVEALKNPRLWDDSREEWADVVGGELQKWIESEEFRKDMSQATFYMALGAFTASGGFRGPQGPSKVPQSKAEYDAWVNRSKRQAQAQQAGQTVGTATATTILKDEGIDGLSDRIMDGLDTYAEIAKLSGIMEDPMGPDVSDEQRWRYNKQQVLKDGYQQWLNQELDLAQIEAEIEEARATIDSMLTIHPGYAMFGRRWFKRKRKKWQDDIIAQQTEAAQVEVDVAGG